MSYYIIVPSFTMTYTELSIILVCITILRNIIKYMINCYDLVTNDCKRVASILLRFVNILSTRLQKDEKSCFNCVPGYVCYQIFDLIPSCNTTQFIKVLMLQESFILIFRNNISQDHFSTIKDNGFLYKTTTFHLSF